MVFADRLRLSDEPLESFLAALFLQFLPDHVPAGLVVVVEPVALQEGRETNRCGVHHDTVTGKQWGVPRIEMTRVNKQKTWSPYSWTSDFLMFYFPGNNGTRPWHL